MKAKQVFEQNSKSGKTKEPFPCPSCLWIIGSIAILIVMLCTLYYGGTRNRLERETECFSMLYDMVRDMDFATGCFEGGILTLYDIVGNQLMTIDVDHASRVGRTMLRKDLQEEQIYFVLGGSVDDEYGVLYTERNQVNMDGLWSIKRMGGNCFYYQTRE